MSLSFNFPPSVEAALRADAEAHGIAVEVVIAEALAQLWVNAPKAPLLGRKLPTPGALASIRLEREARGDFRSGGEIAKEITREEWRLHEKRIFTHTYREDEENLSGLP